MKRNAPHENDIFANGTCVATLTLKLLSNAKLAILFFIISTLSQIQYLYGIPLTGEQVNKMVSVYSMSLSCDIHKYAHFKE